MQTVIWLYKYLSNTSSSKIPSIPAGIQDIIILIHKEIVLHLLLLFFVKTFKSLKYKIITASIAPNWITTLNISIKLWLMLNFKNFSRSIKCPVLLIGNHSVIPSITPYNKIFIRFKKFISLSNLHYKYMKK